MRKYLSILASVLALTASAETVQQLRIINLSGGNDGLAWIDKQGNAHKFDSTNTVSILYASNIVGIINYSNLPAISPTNWSTFSAVSDVDMAGHILFGASQIQVELLGQVTGYGFDEIASSSGNTFIDFNSSSPLTLNNGEAAGVGADINLVSENGDVIVKPKVAFVVDIPIGTESAFVLRNKADVISNGGILFFSPAGSYDMGIAVAGIGQIWNCAAVTGIMSFNAPQHYFGSLIDDGSLAMVQVDGVNDGTPALSVQRGPLFIGTTADDGTGAELQVSHISASSKILAGGFSTSDDGTGAAIQSFDDVSAHNYWAQGTMGAGEDVVIAGTTLHFIGGIYSGHSP